jgi:pimeloyl-ACP methyl ester carboxylesterase
MTMSADMPNLHRFRNVLINGVRLRLAEAGPQGAPLVILAHGWPESWYSWRKQIPALAAAGYRVIAPDMRGFGGSDAPGDIGQYDILHLVGDMLGLMDETGEETAVIAGHDWGALVAWHAALLHPDRFSGVIALSVPHFGRPHDAPTRIWKQRSGDDFFYILYHQQPGLAEAEYDADPEGLLRMLYASPDTPRHPPAIADPDRKAGGWIGRWGEPRELPAWLREEDMEYYVGEFTRAGFRGGLNYYRNFDRNWDLMKDIDQTVKVPALFVVGDKDLTITGYDRNSLEKRLLKHVPDLRGFQWLPGAGHWIQQERPEECNRAMRDFLEGLR